MKHLMLDKQKLQQKQMKWYKMKKNKIIRIIIISIVVVLFLIVSMILKINASHKKEDIKVKKEIEIIGKRFYEESYYNITPKELLKDFTTNGIKITISELLWYEEEPVEKYDNYDINKSNVIIYPKESYEKEDYKIKIILYRK